MRSELRAEIERMELSEKLLLVEDIWDSIAASNADMPLSDWSKAELDKRYSEFREGKLALHDWRTVHEGLRQKYK